MRTLLTDAISYFFKEAIPKEFMVLTTEESKMKDVLFSAELYLLVGIKRLNMTVINPLKEGKIGERAER
jgi:hypothetical protein